MCTPLSKTLSRRVQIGNRLYVVSLIPASGDNRFDRLRFRQARKRRFIEIPLESALNHAAQRQLDWEKREKVRIRKLRREGKL